MDQIPQGLRAMHEAQIAKLQKMIVDAIDKHNAAVLAKWKKEGVQ
jgi:hypothetical protein